MLFNVNALQFDDSIAIIASGPAALYRTLGHNAPIAHVIPHRLRPEQLDPDTLELF